MPAAASRTVATQNANAPNGGHTAAGINARGATIPKRVRCHFGAPARTASQPCSGRQSSRSAPPISTRRSQSLLELLQDRRVLERRHVLGDLLALGDRAQQAAHDLAGARLRQVVAEADVLRLGDRADLLADPVAELLGDLLRL